MWAKKRTKKKKIMPIPPFPKMGGKRPRETSTGSSKRH